MKRKLALAMGLLVSLSATGFAACGDDSGSDRVVSDYYTITVACQTERAKEKLWTCWRSAIRNFIPIERL